MEMVSSGMVCCANYETMISQLQTDPLFLFPIMLGLRLCKLPFVFAGRFPGCQVHEKDEKEHRMETGKHDGGWGETFPCYYLSLLSMLFQHRTWWQQLILIAFNILFCLLSIPRTGLTELLRGSNTSQATPLFRGLCLSSTNSNSQAPELPAGQELLLSSLDPRPTGTIL